MPVNDKENGMITTVVIGKSSNLSTQLRQQIENIVLISAREVQNDISILEAYRDTRINVVFNNFQPAVELSTLENPLSYVESAIYITAKILEFFKENSFIINKIIYTSSSSVYGENIFCSETDEVKPKSLHAALKVANEKLIEKYCDDQSVSYTIARIFNMFGGDDQFSIINKIILAHRNNMVLNVINNGNSIRDFIHIDNVVEIYKAILNTDKSIPLINIGTGKGNSIKGILDFLNNNNIKIQTQNIYKKELKTSTADTRLLNGLVEDQVIINVEEYLEKVLCI